MGKGVENIIIGLTFMLGLIFAITINYGSSSVSFAQTNVSGSALTTNVSTRNGSNFAGGSPSTAPVNTFSANGDISSLIFVRQNPSILSLNPSTLSAQPNLFSQEIGI